MDEQGEKEREPETMSDEDMKLLQDPQLLLYIVREVQAEGIQGCEDAIIVLVNKLTLRKVKGVEPTSCNILISDESGAGKDVITKKTLKVVVLETEYVPSQGQLLSESSWL